MAYTPNPWSLKDITDHARLLAWFQNIEAGIAAASAASAPTSTTGTFNVKDYGALGDNSHDDTTAIQAAIDAAGAVHGCVYLPGTANGYKITSTLKLMPYICFRGDGPFATSINCAAGFTGVAIREKTVGEGSPFGATGLQLRDFGLNGVSTGTDGINIGFQTSNNQLTSTGGIMNVFATGFLGGVAMNICANAASLYYIWGTSSNVGIRLSGGGANMCYALFAEDNASYQVDINESWDNIFGIQVEVSNARSDNTTALVHVGGTPTQLYGCYMNVGWATATKPRLIECASGIAGLDVHNCHVVGAALYSNTCGAAAYGGGTGIGNVREYSYQGDGPSDKKYFQDSATGNVKLAPMTPNVVALTYSATIATNAAQTGNFKITATNTTAFTISNPTNLVEGMTLTYDITNSSGGAMGAVTWGATFKLAGAFTNPLNTKRRTITFYYDGASLVETNRAAADI